jgi:hypothetical protein
VKHAENVLHLSDPKATEHPASEYLVVESTGEIYGVLATADVERALSRAPGGV